MKQIRRGIFETNSSSVHTLTVCTQDDFDMWIGGLIKFDVWFCEFVKPDSCEDYHTNKILVDYDGFLKYCTDVGYEHYADSFTTPSGDEMVAFGYYGHS